MAEIRAVLFDVYGTFVDIKTNEHRDDAFDSLSRFLEYRRVFIAGKALKELYFDQINQQLAMSRERNTIRFYYDLMGVVEDAMSQKKIHDIIEEEKRHVSILRQALEQLQDPQSACSS